jgi:hypothetical protein
MTWAVETGFTRRPLVVVEDHLYHMTELLERLAGWPELYRQLTVVCLVRPGPDTRRTVAEWLASYAGLQVIAADDEGDEADEGEETGESHETGGTAGHPASPAAAGEFQRAQDGRRRALALAAFDSAHRLCQTIAGALRPGGLLLQDVQLASLSFIPADRWWESIYLASTVRGMFAERTPTCRFVSNKRGYEATFGRDLLEAGFDPREVIDKAEITRTVVPLIRTFLDRTFPLALQLVGPGRSRWELRVANGESERGEIEREVDLLLWSGGDGAVELGGRAIAAGESRHRYAFKTGNQEAVTWAALVADRLNGGSGLAVLDVGRRLAPPAADRAEITNAAARHLHTLRGRLEDGAGIVTARHSYHLSERLIVGHARRADQTAAPTAG